MSASVMPKEVASVEDEGRIYTPDMVLGPARKGLKVTYCTDTRPVPTIVEHAKKADLFICEGMYGEPEMVSKATYDVYGGGTVGKRSGGF